jgi:hypothetical protein
MFIVPVDNLENEKPRQGRDLSGSGLAADDQIGSAVGGVQPAVVKGTVSSITIW